LLRRATYSIIALSLFQFAFTLSANGQGLKVTADTSDVYENWTQSETGASHRQSPTTALLKSMVVPGWGQIGNRKYFKAGLVIATEGALFLRWRHFRNKTVEARDLFEAQTELELRRAYYNDYLEVRNDRNLFGWLTGTSIFLSMIDAFVDAHLADFPHIKKTDTNKDSDFSLQIAPIQFSSAETLKLVMVRYSF